MVDLNEVCNSLLEYPYHSPGAQVHFFVYSPASISEPGKFTTGRNPGGGNEVIVTNVKVQRERMALQDSSRRPHQEYPHRPRGDNYRDLYPSLEASF